MVGLFKSAVTKHARRLGFNFDWQSKFHDHIIRNDAEYQRIHHFIENNPFNLGKQILYKKIAKGLKIVQL